MSVQTYTINDTSVNSRDFCLMLVDATDGITPETGEGNGQPQIRKPGQTTWTDTEGTLVHVGNGHYVVLLTTAELSILGVFSIRYKSAETAEFQDVGYIQATGIVSNDDIKNMLISLQQKIDWIEHILNKGEIASIVNKELNIL